MSTFVCMIMVVEEAIKRCVTAICDDLVSLRTVNRRCHSADELLILC